MVVGLYDPVFAGGFNGENFYVPLDAFASVTKKINRGAELYVRTHQHDDEYVNTVTKRL
jgi:hypothetical protein